MSRIRFYLLSAVFSCVLVLGQGGTPEPDIITVPITTPVITTEPPHPNTTSSTTTTTTTTTAKPTTTSQAPPSPTPPAPPAPTPPAPTPAPGPLPPPQQGTWHYTDLTKNVTCIVVQFAAQLTVMYTKMVNKTAVATYQSLNMPANASVAGGNCTGNDQWIKLSWPALPNDNDTVHNLTLVFRKNDTTNTYAMRTLNASLAAKAFINASSPDNMEVVSHSVEWQTPLATSYRCMPQSLLKLSAESTSLAVNMTVSMLQEEAFRSNAGTGFSAARECGGGDVPDAVPIAVGCALGGLVVVVLVAYLVGRRRSAARGYLSM